MDMVRIPSLAERRATAAKVIERWRTNPLVVEYIRRSEMERVPSQQGHPSMAPPVTSPDQVVGEMGLLALSLAIASEQPNQVAVGNHQENSDEAKAYECTRLAFLLTRATPYLWINSIIDEALRSVPPRHVVADHLVPTQISWFTRETADSPQPDIARDGWLLIDHGDSLEITDIGSTDDGRLWLYRTGLKYGQIYPDGYPTDQVKAIGQWLSVFAFLNSPYVGSTPTRASRPMRRALEQSHDREPDPIVQFVALRAPASETHEPTHNLTTTEYHRRWFVRGHLRAQWYPSKQSHKLIWIAPYIKGPEDKPLVNTIYKVAR